MTIRLTDSLGTTGPLADVFSDRSLLAAMLQFEVGLARAQARLGIIPADAAEHIAAAEPDEFDSAAIALAAPSSGTMAIAFLEQLTAMVERRDAASAGYVHWGATSQDATDTAMVLLLARVRALLQADHKRMLAALRSLSNRYAASTMIGRTLLQPATPVTFGLKAAAWYAACARGWARVEASFDEALVLEFGGASGTLAALGGRGLDVSAELGRELGLPVPDAPWHAHRDRLAALVAACGIYTGTLGKIATDIALLMQREVGEVSEPGGGSSSMPQKRNPAGCAVVLAAATRVPALVAAFLSGMVQQHERGLGGGQAELPTVAALLQATGAALAALAGTVEALQVDAARMAANLKATRGTVLAERAVLLLTRALGRDAARALVSGAALQSAQTGRTLSAALGDDPRVAAAVTADELSSLDHPDAYLGVAETLRRRLLADA
ncbi:MAG: lyase family protein [Acidobacteriota bacterium]